jgi:hypothetical protein
MKPINISLKNAMKDAVAEALWTPKGAAMFKYRKYALILYTIKHTFIEKNDRADQLIIKYSRRAAGLNRKSFWHSQ